LKEEETPQLLQFSQVNYISLFQVFHVFFQQNVFGSLEVQYRGEYKGWAPGKLTGCEDHFTRLVDHQEESFLIKKFSLKSFARL